MGYYILIKRKGSKTWLGAIPSKSGASLSKLRSLFSKKLKKGYTYKIVSSSQLKRYLVKIKPSVGKRRVRIRRKARRVKRRKTRVGKRRKKAKRSRRKTRSVKRKTRRTRRRRRR